jgi:hypothetical protein
VVINGIGYEKDLFILPNGEIEKRMKKLSKVGVGHTPLSKRELKEYIKKARPDFLVIGTGMHGAMKVKDGARKFSEKNGIKLICQRTGMAIDTYLDLLCKNEKVAAVLHLTC